MLQKLFDNRVGRDTVGTGLVTEGQTVTQAVGRDIADIVRQHVVATLEPSTGARAPVQRQRTARARPDLDPASQIRGVALRIPGRKNQIDHVTLDHFADRDLGYLGTRIEDRLLSHGPG